MKVTAIHDQSGNIVAALRIGSQTLPDGRVVAAVVQLQPGQTLRIVDVADNLAGRALLDAADKATSTP